MTSWKRQTGYSPPIVRAPSNARWQEPPCIQRFARAAVTRCAATITRLAAHTLGSLRRDRLGLALRAGAIEAVYVRGARVIWCERVDISSPRAIGEPLRRVIASAPRARRRPRVMAAFGPLWAHTKRLFGPSEASTQAAVHVVREYTAGFFHHRLPVVIASAHRARDGSLWSCAFDRNAIDAVTMALDERQLRLHAVLPAVGAVGYDEFTCARAATRYTSRTPLVWRPPNRLHRAARCLRIAVIGAVLCAASSLLAALTAPSVRGQTRIALGTRCGAAMAPPPRLYRIHCGLCRSHSGP